MSKNSGLIKNDKKYWQDRHAATGNLKASGVKSVSVKSNNYIYKILTEQYAKLLSQIDLSEVESVLDAGYGDGYFLNFLKDDIPGAEIYGIDISKDAKEKVDYKKKENLSVGDMSTYKFKKKYDYVHCFDVLYHILSDEDYIDAINNLTSASNKYVVLHERFLAKSPKISSKHVRLRTAEYTNQLLNKQGFFLIKEIPTHFFAMRMLTYKINSIIPSIFYKIDKSITSSHPSRQLSLASHKIRVYVKAEK